MVFGDEIEDKLLGVNECKYLWGCFSSWFSKKFEKIAQIAV